MECDYDAFFHTGWMAVFFGAILSGKLTIRPLKSSEVRGLTSIWRALVITLAVNASTNNPKPIVVVGHIFFLISLTRLLMLFNKSKSPILIIIEHYASTHFRSHTRGIFHVATEPSQLVNNNNCFLWWSSASSNNRGGTLSSTTLPFTYIYDYFFVIFFCSNRKKHFFFLWIRTANNKRKESLSCVSGSASMDNEMHRTKRCSLFIHSICSSCLTCHAQIHVFGFELFVRCMYVWLVVNVHKSFSSNLSVPQLSNVSIVESLDHALLLTLITLTLMLY